MKYRMVQVGTEPDGRARWRGTGFNPSPGGVTWIGDERLGWIAKIFHWCFGG